MADYEYTCGTTYTFTTSCTNDSNAINLNLQTPGVYSQSKIEDVLKAGDNMFLQFVIPEILDLPAEAPEIIQVVSVNSCIDVVSQSVIKTPTVTGYTSNGVNIPGQDIPNSQCTTLTGRKLVVELLLTEKISYTADLPGNPLHSVTFKFPCSTFLIIDKDTAISEYLKVTPYIVNVSCCKLSETNIFKSTLVFITVE